MTSRPLLCALIALSLGASTWAQNPAPAKEEGEAKRPFLNLPMLELGDSYADSEFGFEFRLPKGFSVYPDLDQLRAAQIVPESERLGPDGKPNRVQIFLFQNQTGATILIRANDPAFKIENPAELRNTMSEADTRAGNPTRNVGKLYQFKMRGGDVGFFAEREFGSQLSRQVTHHQYMAYMRSGSRSLLVQFSAPIPEFEAVADPFKACLGSFILREGRLVEAAKVAEPRRWKGSMNATVLANLGVAMALVSLLVWLLPRRATS